MGKPETQVDYSKLEPTYVVVTAYAISLFPKMLAVINPSYKLVIPSKFSESALFDYLSDFQKPAKLRLLFQGALDSSIIETRDIKGETTSANDIVIDLTKCLLEEGKSVIIVGVFEELNSLRKSVGHLSIINSVEVIGTKDFRLLLNTPKSAINSELLELVKEFQIERARIPIVTKWWPLSEFIGLLITMLLTLKKPQFIFSLLSHLNIWVGFFLIIFISIFLFWYRAKHRLYYGILETVFGVIVAASVFYSTFDYSQLLTVDYIKLVSGIYIIIRGLDNIERGLPYIDSEFIKDLWRKWFEPPEPWI